MKTDNLQPETVASAEAKPDSPATHGSGHITVELRWWPTTLESCPPGLFWFGDSFGFKTEYSDDNGPEAYCVESGEYFWGGAKGDKEVRRKLVVTPCIIVSNELSSPTAADGNGGAERKH